MLKSQKKLIIEVFSEYLQPIEKNSKVI